VGYNKEQDVFPEDEGHGSLRASIEAECGKRRDSDRKLCVGISKSVAEL
jgi:hypothetical protein